MKITVTIELEPGESITLARACEPDSSLYTVSSHEHAKGLVGCVQSHAHSHTDLGEMLTRMGRQARGKRG